MFCLHERAELGGARIASYPPATPPTVFLRALLRRRGLDPDRDVRLEPCRDDAARLGLLRAGEVAGAVLSSALPPDLGFPRVAFFGDELHVPTTGLALREEFLAHDRDTAAALVAALRRSLERTHAGDPEVARISAELFYGASDEVPPRR